MAKRTDYGARLSPFPETLFHFRVIPQSLQVLKVRRRTVRQTGVFHYAGSHDLSSVNFRGGTNVSYSRPYSTLQPSRTNGDNVNSVTRAAHARLLSNSSFRVRTGESRWQAAMSSAVTDLLELNQRRLRVPMGTRIRL
jgi:hypothetical protein